MRAILTYHSIDDSGSPISVSRRQFEAHLQFLASAPIEVVPLEELAHGPNTETPRVALTFDDGFENLRDVAWPLLRDAGLPATLFVVSGHVGHSNAWGGVADSSVPTLPLLDWDALGQLNEAGLDLGAHTHTHPRLTEVHGSALAEELERPVAELSDRLGIQPTSLAYPYGDVDSRIVEASRSLYRTACTTRLAALGASDDPVELPRLDMFYFRDPGRLEAFGSTAFKAYVGFRRALRSIRAKVGRP